MRKELDIQRIEQKTSNWCWAACAQMAIKFIKNNNLTQEQIVAVMYDVSLDRVSVDNPDCNTPATVHDIKTVYDEYSVYHKSSASHLTYQALKEEIDAGRPIEIGISWKGGGKHAVMVFGYNTNGKSLQEVLIRDPLRTTSSLTIVDYQTLIDGKFRVDGKWVHTFYKLDKQIHVIDPITSD